MAANTRAVLNETGASGKNRSARLLSGSDRAAGLGLTLAVYGALVALLLLLPGQTREEMPPMETLAVIQILPPPPDPPLPEPVEQAPDPLPSIVPEPVEEAPPPPLVLERISQAPVMPQIVLTIPLPVEAGESSSGQGATGDGEASRAGGGGDGEGSGTGGSGAGAKDGADGGIIRTGQWRRRPTARDFNTPPNMRRGAPRQGWGEIICVSARNDRLTDCVTHAEYPAGSGFSEAMREVSSRFRYMVRDPKGKPVVGQRVLVHLNFLPPR